MKTFFKFLAVVLLSIGSFVGTSLTTQAGTITQTISLATSGLPLQGDTFNFNQINLLGTLDSVQLQVDSSWAITNSEYNSSSTAYQHASVATLFNVLFDTSGSTNFANTFSGDGSVIYQSLTSASNFRLGGHATTNFGVTASFDTNVTYTSGNYDLSEFLGTGTMPLTVDANASANDSFGVGSATLSGKAELSGTLIYNYSGSVIIPEPSAGILLGVGGLICWGWRRKIGRKTTGALG